MVKFEFRMLQTIIEKFSSSTIDSFRYFKISNPILNRKKLLKNKNRPSNKNVCVNVEYKLFRRYFAVPLYSPLHKTLTKFNCSIVNRFFYKSFIHSLALESLSTQ